MKTHFTYKNGVFVEDTENYCKLPKTAFTVYTGGVLILTDCYFDKNRKRYCGEHNGVEMELKPSQILAMDCIA